MRFGFAEGLPFLLHFGEDRGVEIGDVDEPLKAEADHLASHHAVDYGVEPLGGEPRLAGDVGNLIDGRAHGKIGVLPRGRRRDERDGDGLVSAHPFAPERRALLHVLCKGGVREREVRPRRSAFSRFGRGTSFKEPRIAPVVADVRIFRGEFGRCEVVGASGARQHRRQTRYEGRIEYAADENGKEKRAQSPKKTNEKIHGASLRKSPSGGEVDR